MTSAYARSAVFVPFLNGAELHGVVGVINQERENVFTDSDVRLVETLANSMNVALQNAQSFKAEQERVAELQIINSIQQGLAAELGFQAIVDLVGDKLLEVFNTKDFGIRWYDEKANLVYFLYEYEHGERLKVEPRTPPLDSAFARILKTRKSIIWNTRAEGDAIALTIPGTDDSSRSGVQLPIISSDRVLGTISVENYERENAYGESELRLLTTIAASLGTALENARLFDETQRLLKITEERAAELAIINSVSEGLVRELNFQAIIDLVGEKIRQDFKVEDMYIAMYDEASNLLSTPYYIEHGDRFPIEPMTLRPGYAGWTITNRTTLVINENIVQRKKEMGMDTNILIGDTQQAEDLTQSVVCAPIWSTGKVIGVITLYSNEPNAFPESSVSLLTTLSANLGVALQNARLFDETQRLLKITEDRAAELAIINSVQEGLASKLDMQAIYELVGNKLCEVFDSQDLDIRLLNQQTGMIEFPYLREHGEVIHVDPSPLRGVSKRVIESRQPLVINENLVQAMQELGGYTIPGTDVEKSLMAVPIIIGNKAIGLVFIGNYEKEHAFGESDVRLLQTVVNAMSVALENARLFDETQRLLTITEDRATELSVINSIQQGLAAELDPQAIIELTGDKLREVLHTEDLGIRLYDTQNNLIHYVYEYIQGERREYPSKPPVKGGTFERITKTRQPFVRNTLAEREALGLTLLPGTEAAKSASTCPSSVVTVSSASSSYKVTKKNTPSVKHRCACYKPLPQAWV